MDNGRGLVDYFVTSGLNPEVDFAAELQIESGGLWDLSYADG
jgi:hypothetical protein